MAALAELADGTVLVEDQPGRRLASAHLPQLF
jgi:hypothetical protein